ncbi:MAG: CBS domain-containing protein [Gammaproteobacteria bacterium]|nr:CBS domain-containing protein [Gammaproteobacteria bacterium]
MAYTLYGPNLRDTVVLDRLFQGRVVEQTSPADNIHPLAGHGEGQSNTKQRLADHLYRQTAHVPTKTPEPAIHAAQIMSAPVVTLPEDASILSAWALFRERRFRHLPVVGKHGMLVGILSDRDMLRYAATHGRVPPYDADSPEALLSIQGLYKPRVLTATPDTEIRQIARILLEQRIGAMPIVDDTGRLLGMITRSDILRTLVHHMPLELWV